MNTQSVNRAIEAGYHSSYADLPRVLSRCEWATGTIAFLAAIEKDAGFFRGVVIRWLIGWLAEWKRETRCE